MDRRGGPADHAGLPQDRPARGSLEDLRLRLQRLPTGHPSSPYDDQGAVKSAPQDLRQLELPLADEERESDSARSSRRLVTAVDHDGPARRPVPDFSVAAPAAAWTADQDLTVYPLASPGSDDHSGNGGPRDSMTSAAGLAHGNGAGTSPAEAPGNGSGISPADALNGANVSPPEAFSNGWRDPEQAAAVQNGHAEILSAGADRPEPADQRRTEYRRLEIGEPGLDGETPERAPYDRAGRYGAGLGKAGYDQAALGRADYEQADSGRADSGRAGYDRAGYDLAVTEGPAVGEAGRASAFRNGGGRAHGLTVLDTGLGGGLYGEEFPDDRTRDDRPRDNQARDDRAHGDEARDDQARDDQAEPTAGARYGLTPDEERIADQAIDRYQAADGRNVFGGYGESGLTPAIRRVESSLPRGRLAPDTEEYTLKSPERYKEKLARLIARNPGVPARDLAEEIYDAARYTFVFEPPDYTDGTWLVHRRLKAQGFELEARRNRWESPEYKGIRTRWRDPAHDLAFEVQFHTPSSWDVVRQTHDAYLRITDPDTPAAERAELRARQVAAAAATRPPPRSAEIGDFRADVR